MKIREEMRDIIGEAQCGYCETSHNCDKAHEELTDQAVDLLKKYLQSVVPEKKKFTRDEMWRDTGFEEKRGFNQAIDEITQNIEKLFEDKK